MGTQLVPRPSWFRAGLIDAIIVRKPPQAENILSALSVRTAASSWKVLERTFSVKLRRCMQVAAQLSFAYLTVSVCWSTVSVSISYFLRRPPAFQFVTRACYLLKLWACKSDTYVLCTSMKGEDKQTSHSILSQGNGGPWLQKCYPVASSRNQATLVKGWMVVARHRGFAAPVACVIPKDCWWTARANCLADMISSAKETWVCDSITTFACPKRNEKQIETNLHFPFFAVNGRVREASSSI